MSLLMLLAAAMIVGAFALRPLGPLAGLERPLYSVLVGLCICAAPIVLAGSFSLQLARALVVFSGFVGLTGALFVWRRYRRTVKRDAEDGWRGLEPLEWVSVVAIALALFLALISALAPATSWDAGVAHLALPSDYAREGRLTAFEGNAYSAYPHLLHSLFAVVYPDGGETAVQLLSWLCGGLACASAYCLGKRLEGRRCGLIAAAIVATAPIFVDQAGSASLDLAFSGMVLAALNAFLAWRQEQRMGWLVLAGYLAGSACGVRHTGYLVCVLLGTAALMAERRTWARALGCFAIAGTLGAMPWLIRSAIVAGNPFYPFLSSVFSPGLLPDAEITALGEHESIRDAGWLGLLLFPWRVIVHPDWYDGWSKSPGGMVLALGVPGLVVGGRRARWLGAFSVAGLVCFYFFQQYARYLLPFFLPMMVVAAVAACRLRTLRIPIAVLLTFSYGFGLVLAAGAVHFKAPVVLGVESREEYLARRVERYPAFAWMNEQPIGEEFVTLTLDQRSYYLSMRTYQNLEALRWLVGKQPREQLDWLRSRRIKYVFVPHAYLEETPGMAEVGLLGMFERWWSLQDTFVCIKRMELPRPRKGGTEAVAIYEIHYPSEEKTEARGQGHG